jgi:hypothetical protein
MCHSPLFCEGEILYFRGETADGHGEPLQER